MKFSIVLPLTATLLATACPAFAEMVSFVDAAGRTVEIDAPAKRILLGEGRQMHAIAALRGEEAFDNIVGWQDDLITKDSGTYENYRASFPDIENLPRFGYPGKGEFNLEGAIALKPDVMTINLESEQFVLDSGMEERLKAAGVTLVYIDFRVDPEANTETSLRALGEIFGESATAEEFIDYRRAQFAAVTDVLAKQSDLERPTVFIESAPGIRSSYECCRTFGPLNFGEMIELAGGHNLGSDYITTMSGVLNPEQLVVSDPDKVMVTGANWGGISDVNQFVDLGPGSDTVAAREELANLMTRQPFNTLSAVRNGEVYGIWHQFYGVPYDFMAVQYLAKWLHPELFADLDPDANFAEFHERFLPIDYRPGYTVSLHGGTN